MGDPTVYQVPATGRNIRVSPKQLPAVRSAVVNANEDRAKARLVVFCSAKKSSWKGDEMINQ